MWHKWVRKILQEETIFELLIEIDREELGEASQKACPHCGGRLDRGDYVRKPRGQPKVVPEQFSIRFSLCCSREGCRRRLTPFSVRFLARKVYVCAAVVLVAAAMQGLSRLRIKRLSELLGIPRRTARRWLVWWQSKFAGSNFFKSIRGLLPQTINADELPIVLLNILSQSEQQPSLTTLTALKLLRPITSATAPNAQPC